MIPEFERLSEGEVDLMLKSPFLVCILVAGADDNIDRKEIRGAFNTVKKSASESTSVYDFYKEVEQDFEDKLKVLIAGYPYEPEKRNPVLINELEGLNKILPKLDQQFAGQFYKSILSLAQETASSSGGLLGIASVGEQESAFLSLDMIKNPAGS